MQEERKDIIIKVLTQKGAMGVNALARELGIATTTLQKSLTNQSYFRQNSSKKWDLPENVTKDTRHNILELQVKQAELAVQVIRNQVEELLLSVENALPPLQTLKRDISNMQHPVAKSSDVAIERLPASWRNIAQNLTEFPTIIKTKKNTTNPEMYELLSNTDWFTLVLEMGLTYFRDALSTDIYDVLLGQNTQLSEDSLESIKQYQIGQAEKSDTTDM